MQHNCAAHGCDDSARVPVFQEQERIATGERHAIRHHVPDDVILNTSQMRDARYVQQFRLVAPPLDREVAIFTGAKAEIDARNSQMVKGKAPRRKRQMGPLILAKSMLSKVIDTRSDGSLSLSWSLSLHAADPFLFNRT